MKRYIVPDNWKIIEDHFDPEKQKSSESLFSIGNGHMGQRANFEETYSGSTLKGNYLAGIYYPDKTKVGWWKNGYPEYFAKVLNAPEWTGIRFICNGNELDLANMQVTRFTRILDLKKGLLQREFEAFWPDGSGLKARTERFLSMTRREVGAIRYTLSPLHGAAVVQVISGLNGDVYNEDANYAEKFWKPVDHQVNGIACSILNRTKKTSFEVCTSMITGISLNGQQAGFTPELSSGEDHASAVYALKLKQGEELVVTKIVSVVTSRDHDPGQLIQVGQEVLNAAHHAGYETLLREQVDFWNSKWNEVDIQIKGDISAQQGIRFNIFQLTQTYTGHDARLNIGPKGFTGEKYGGSTYWDTEAYCLPFYLNARDHSVAKNLLLYRYRQLDKAIENAEKLGFTSGAALYPMVTMNGEECHNEWEITFEEIHRNGAIAFAIFNYIRHTGEKDYLLEGGLEVLIAISRFWSQRITYSTHKKRFVMLGVTGPNEYENNVNNNWYTNYLASWTLQYTIECIVWALQRDTTHIDKLLQKVSFDSDTEIGKWRSIIELLYFPEDTELGIFLQQEGYMDKEQVLAVDLDPAQRPINQHWSWDRILRSCFIKQADVLLGLYIFEDHFTRETLRRNFTFYESRTVHESSLSPCVHSILASKLGMAKKAYELYLQTSRLDLDDYNHEVQEGCHITSMAGTWLALVEGFGGMRVREDKLLIHPLLPEHWETLGFMVYFRSSLVRIKIGQHEIKVETDSENQVPIVLLGNEGMISSAQPVCIRY